MATLHPTNETSPLLEGQNVEHSIQERAVDSRDQDDDVDKDITPEPWTQGDVIKYGIFTLFILVASIFVFIAIRKSPDSHFDFKLALKQALGGGLSGAAAMIIQVLTLMPLRTIMNYQYRYGTGTRHAARSLYQEGGYRRYYSGLGAALIQGPIARFGDTAANVGIFALLATNPVLKDSPWWVKTMFAALAAAAFRMILTPIDTLKTTLQTQGKAGLPILRNRIRKYGIGTLWYGAFATAAATAIGFYPWFGTYNYLNDHLPPPQTFFQKLLRQAFMGFVASVISDTISNSMRVVKTYRQVNATRISYAAAAREVIRVDGISGLLGRGLKTRILANGLQGLMFSILWRLFLDLWNSKT